MSSLPTIKPDQLRVGLYVSLDLPWMKHSFISNNFKIKSEKQITEIKRFGLQQIQYDPDRSDVPPLAHKENAEPQTPAPEPVKEDRGKEIRKKKLQKRRLKLTKCKKEFAETAVKIRNIMGSMRANPKMAVEAAGKVVEDMVENLLAEEDAAIHLVNMKSKSESAYYHSINVTTLSLMLGKKLGLNKKEMHLLGLGAIFHDLGYIDIPDKILRKKEPLTKAEMDFYKMHPTYGIKLAEKIGAFPDDVLRIIGQHHEMMDGSGYPKGVKGDSITLLTRIVALVNRYDNHCNKMDSNASLSPYEAISTIFSKEKGKYDKDVLNHFISYMSIYPPGTVIKLTDGSIGAVIAINHESLLKPTVLIYDPKIPKEEALMLDLTEEELGIVESIRRSTLSPEMLEYLDLGDTVNYYFSSSSGSDKPVSQDR